MGLPGIADDELITFRDGATGERVALTAAEVGGWTAATAALLTDECSLGRGDRAAVLLPPHWQTAAVLLGAWAAGIEVSFRGWATAGLSPAGLSPASFAPAGPPPASLSPAGPKPGGHSPASERLDVSFVEASRIGSWLDEVPSATHQFVLSLAPAAASADPVPAGYRDFPTAVRAYLGAPAPHPTAAVHEAASVDGTTFGEYGAVARAVADQHGIGAGDRVLVDAAIEEPLIWLLPALSAGASIVICKNMERSRLDATIAEEHATKVLT